MYNTVYLFCGLFVGADSSVVLVVLFCTLPRDRRNFRCY